MCKVVLNSELNGVEMYFEGKPVQTIIDSLKALKFRWNGLKKCWYAKQSAETIAVAQKYSNIEIATETITSTKAINKNISLWNRVQFIEGKEDTSKYDYRYVGSNYSGLTVKDTAKIIRTNLKKQFPEVKFSVTSDRNSLDITIKSSPYCNDKLEYNSELECIDYREFEKEHNKELIAIKKYCSNLLSSYNYDDSDSQSDYFNTHFYNNVKIDYDYIQTEQSEVIKNNIADFRNKLIEQIKIDEEVKEAEFQKYLAEKEIEHQAYLLRVEEEKKQLEQVNNNIKVVEIEEDKQYFIIGSEFANLNKNCTLDQYKEEVSKGDFYLQNVKITKEVHFNNIESLENFSNLLLNDFDFLTNTGGSYTDDKRINSMTDYHNMSEAERKTVEFNLYGVAVYFNNKLQFVIDAQGYNYARYIGLTDNATIEKNYIMDQVISDEEVEKLEGKANIIIDISIQVIEKNNLGKEWNKTNWEQYKSLMKAEFKNYELKPTKAIIQQIPEDLDSLKVAMYKILTEVDGIQEQFSNAELKEDQKITMFYIGDMGGMITSKVVFKSVINEGYAQYNNAVKVVFRPQNKKNDYYTHFYSTILVYNGWVELSKTVLYEVGETKGFITSKSKYGSCDHKQYDEILNYFSEQGIKPVINTYKPEF